MSVQPRSIKALLKRLARRLHLLQLAAWGYELYRLIRRPHTHGALVAIWHNNQVLMVQTSYGKGYGLPGGGLHPGESAREAAVRELNESWGWRSKAAGCRSHGRSQNNNEAGATR